MKLLLALAGGFMVNIIMGTLFSLVSIFWVGRLGANALAAVTLASNPLTIVLTLAPIITVGERVLISHAVGAGDRDRASLVFNEAFGASLIVTTFIGVFLWVNRLAFGSILTSDPATASLIADYLRWLIPAFVVQVPMSVLGAALGGTGNMRAIMLAQTGSTILRIVLSPLLIFGSFGAPRLGIAGAGLAAFLGSAICAAGLLLYFARAGSYLRLRPHLWFSRPNTLWGALKIGLPTGMEAGVVAGYMMMITLLIRPFGPIEQAAFGIGQLLFQAGIMPLVAISGAASVLAGQNFGARLSTRVRGSFSAAVALGMTVTPMLWLIVAVFSHRMFSFFSNDPAVIDGGVRFLRIASFSFIPSSVVFAAFAVLAGLGNTKASLVTSTTHVVLVLLPAYFLVQQKDFSPDWLWELMVAATVVEMLMALFFVRREFRKRLGPVEPDVAIQLSEAQ
jgi:putative MATE family efflux protein